MLNHPPALDRIFHALADPSRRCILEHLCCGPASVSLLADPLAMSLPAVIQHLRVLETAGLVWSHKAGRERIYHLDCKALDMAEQWLARQRMNWEYDLIEVNGPQG